MESTSVCYLLSSTVAVSNYLSCHEGETFLIALQVNHIECGCKILLGCCRRLVLQCLGMSLWRPLIPCRRRQVIVNQSLQHGLHLCTSQLSAVTMCVGDNVTRSTSLQQTMNHDDCLDDKREDYQNCYVLCCVRQLYIVICTHTHTHVSSS